MVKIFRTSEPVDWKRCSVSCRSFAMLFFLFLFAASCNDRLPEAYEYGHPNEPAEFLGGDADDGLLPDGDGVTPDGDDEASTDGDGVLPDGDADGDPEETITCMRRISEPGFGDAMNQYAYAMIAFNDRLFVGTFNGSGGSFVNQNPNDSEGAEVWAYDGEGWARVANRGFGNPDNVAVRTFAEYNGKLYAGTINYETGGEVWVTSDGENWKAVQREGLGDPGNVMIASMLVFLDKLYVGTENRGSGAQILRLETNRFQVRASEGFGSPGNYSVNAMTAFKGFLIFGTTNVTGGELFRFDGSNLHRIVGLGSVQMLPAGHSGILALTTFNRRLIFSTVNLVSGFGMFTSKDMVLIEQIGSDGMGDSNMAYGWSFAEFGDWLFMGTFSQGTLFNLFGTGSNLYMTRDAVDLVKMVGENGRWAGPGIGDDHNYGIPSMAIYNDKLYIGTAQCYFCNGRAGLEIWEIDDPTCR